MFVCRWMTSSVDWTFVRSSSFSCNSSVLRATNGVSATGSELAQTVEVPTLGKDSCAEGVLVTCTERIMSPGAQAPPPCPPIALSGLNSECMPFSPLHTSPVPPATARHVAGPYLRDGSRGGACHSREGRDDQEDHAGTRKPCHTCPVSSLAAEAPAYSRTTSTVWLHGSEGHRPEVTC